MKAQSLDATLFVFSSLGASVAESQACSDLPRLVRDLEECAKIEIAGGEGISWLSTEPSLCPSFTYKQVGVHGSESASNAVSIVHVGGPALL